MRLVGWYDIAVVIIVWFGLTLNPRSQCVEPIPNPNSLPYDHASDESVSYLAFTHDGGTSDNGISTIKLALYSMITVVYELTRAAGAAAASEPQPLAPPTHPRQQRTCDGLSRVAAITRDRHSRLIALLPSAIGLDAHTAWMTRPDAATAPPSPPHEPQQLPPAPLLRSAVPISHYFDLEYLLSALPPPVSAMFQRSPSDGATPAPASILDDSVLASTSELDRLWLHVYNASCTELMNPRSRSSTNPAPDSTPAVSHPNTYHVRTFPSIGYGARRYQFTANDVPAPLPTAESQSPADDDLITFRRLLNSVFRPSARIQRVLNPVLAALCRALATHYRLANECGDGSAWPREHAGAFNSIYLRTEADWARVCADYDIARNCYVSVADTIRRLAAIGLDRSVPLFLGGASTRDESVLAAFEAAGFTVWTKERLLPTSELFGVEFGSNDRAIVEHEICVRSAVYVGHVMSSFSLLVKETRIALPQMQARHASLPVDRSNYIVNEPLPATVNAQHWRDCNGAGTELCGIERALYHSGCVNTQRRFKQCWKRVMES